MDRHPLQGGYARLDRGGEHFADLQGEVARFRDEHSSSVTTYLDSESGGYFYGGSIVEVPDRISILAGEAIQSQRIALDYLIYALAEFDSGQPQADTQFPITTFPASFLGAKGAGRLRGLSDEHVAAVEALQPYDGRDALQWLRVFNELSKPDKHRHPSALTVLITPMLKGGEWSHMSIWELFRAGQRWDLARRPRPLRSVTQADPPRGRPYGFGQAPEHLRGNVDVKLDVSFDVAFWQGPPVEEALELFQSEVRSLIDAFEPEFEWR